jgi:hypothetical protein
MARRLNTFVHVHVDGEHVVYGPGDTVPKAVAKLIGNPDVWADGEGAPEPDEVTPDEVTPDEVTPDEVTPDEVERLPIPPKGGPAATRDAWIAYARDNGFEADEDASRKDVIAALDAAGVPTE